MPISQQEIFELSALNAIEQSDEFFPFNKWPQWAKSLFLIKHKDRNQRFRLWIFFWKNGMEANRARYWVMFGGGYDRSAWSSMQDLVNKTQTPQGRAYLGKFPVYDILADKVH